MERAKEHRDALQAHIDETFAVEANRPRLGAKFDPERGENIVFVNRMPDLTDFYERSSIILGDAVHCLRSALDHLAFQLSAREQGPKLEEGKTMFVIADCPKQWNTGSKRWLAQVHPDDLTIIERYQGYHRIDEQLAVGPYFHPLAMLRDLDDTDKHRLLNTLAVPSTSFSLKGGAASAIVLFEVQDLTESLSTGDTSDFEAEPVELGTVVAHTRHMEPLETEEENSGYMTPAIAIAEGRPAVQVLDKVAATVTKIIREFEPFP
jgi:hypothetical protein